MFARVRGTQKIGYLTADCRSLLKGVNGIYPSSLCVRGKNKPRTGHQSIPRHTHTYHSHSDSPKNGFAGLCCCFSLTLLKHLQLE